MTQSGETAQQNHSLNPYEGMFLLPGAAGSDVEGALKLVRGIIERHQGQVLVLKKWDERKLAYEVGRQKRGLYVLAYFNAPGEAVAGIERDVNLSDQVLRVLVTAADHLNQPEMEAVEPQPILPREERNSWDRPEGRRDERREERSGRSSRKEEIPAPSAKD
jgi:small subunit ribosomal protein S6